MLKKISNFIPKKLVGIYRDDGLAAIKPQSGQKTENVKKQLHEMVNKIGLKIEIEGPITKTDFLDLSFDLKNGKYGPYRKENNEIKYIRSDSNHPKTIIKQIPNMISTRLSNRSYNEEEFAKISKPYNEALKKVDTQKK